MKPAPFDYAAPATLDELLDLLADAGDDAAVIAGGQSLVPLLNLRLARPELVVDPRRVPGLAEVAVDEAGVTVGAMTRAADLEAHPAVGRVPGLAACLAHVGHSQIRARTTIGGSVAHADPAAELPALLAALDGTVTLTSRERGTREVAAADFFVGPLMTGREPDELVTAVRFPAVPEPLAIVEVATRPGDFALVAAIAGAAVDADQIVGARIVVFGVAGTPLRLGEAENLLVGSAPTEESWRRAGDSIREHLDAHGDAHASAEYRTELAAVLVERALGAPI